MELNELIYAVSFYLSWIAAPAVPLLLLRAIKKIHKDEEYSSEALWLICCTLILCGQMLMF